MSQARPPAEWTDFSIPEFPVSGNAYSLTMLEAWRRGLMVEIEGDGVYTISSEFSRVRFRLSRLASESARQVTRIVNDKVVAKRYFDAAGVNTPASEYFELPCSKEDVLNAADRIGYPVVLKATGWSKGKGVFANIQERDSLGSFFDQLVHDLGSDRFLLEKHILTSEQGDVRAYVVGDQVVAAVSREPANVVGDGTHTITELVEQKNQVRRLNPFLKNGLIHLDAEAKSRMYAQGFEADSVPGEGVKVVFRGAANASSGGDTIDVTDSLPEAAKRVAVEAVRAIPNLYHGGVDVLLPPDDPFGEQASVLEINAAAELGVNIYPMYGTGRFPSLEIIDYYFPQSRRLPQAEFWYFDLKQIYEILRATATRVEVSPCLASDEHLWQTALLTGSVQGVGLRRRIVRLARKRNVHGDVRNDSNGSVVVRTCGLPEDSQAFYAELAELAGTPESGAVEVSEAEPFRIVQGFRIIK